MRYYFLFTFKYKINRLIVFVLWGFLAKFAYYLNCMENELFVTYRA